MTQKLQSLAQALLDAAKTAGAQAADAIVVDGRSIDISLRKGALEQAQRSEEIELGLRVLIDGRHACVSVSDISERTIADVAERAVAMAKEAPIDPYAGLADPSELIRTWDLAALEIYDNSAEPQADVLQEGARRAEAAALAAGDITQVEASAGYSTNHVYLAASNGFSGGYGRSTRYISAVAFTGAGNKMERDWSGEARIYQSDVPDAEQVGAQAAARALARSGARKPKTGFYPVLFDERIASSLIGHLLSAVNGAMISRGSSWLLQDLGRQILPKGMDVVEDPLRRRTSGSRPFDAEGLATKKRFIVQDGVLMGWTLDLANARKLGMQSTASATRATSSAPQPSTSNIDLSVGNLAQDDLLTQMGTGLLVTSMIGSTINPNTGDYSRGASGFWVENGEITYAVNECTVAGNLRDMLGKMVAGNDTRAHLSTRVPSLLIDGLTLAGA